VVGRDGYRDGFDNVFDVDGILAGVDLLVA
jgi:hypothetical protein